MRRLQLSFYLVALAVCASPAHAQNVVEVYPGEDLEAIVYEHPPGTEFLLKAGTHRRQQVEPRDGDTFTGEPGAVMSGALTLESWVQEGPYWTQSGMTQQGQVHGVCAGSVPDYRGCAFPEDLFLDGQPLWQVTSLDDLNAPGEWFFDYDRDKIYILEDPRAAVLELSSTPDAFHGSARGVTIRGLTIEKYAAPAQHGAVHGMDGTLGALSSGWVVKDNVIRLNHGLGIRTGDGMQVSGNQLVRNGQLGIGGSGVDILVENNEISSNNYAGFDTDWEGGGAKWVLTEGLVVRNNRVERNQGPGLWTDTDNIDVLYEGNTVRGNTRAGIFHEISQAATIRDNIVEKNGKSFDVWLWGAQILISSSRDVDVYGNSVVVAKNGGNGITIVQQDRGSGIRGPHLAVNNYVHDNEVTYLGNWGLTGADADYDPDGMYDANNAFESNTYLVANLGQSHWFWEGMKDWPSWQATGQDVAGTAELSPPPQPACGLLGIELLLVPPLASWCRRMRSSRLLRSRPQSAP